MNWAGIANDNEFYSDHYLSEVFVKDTKELRVFGKICGLKITSLLVS